MGGKHIHINLAEGRYDPSEILALVRAGDGIDLGQAVPKPQPASRGGFVAAENEVRRVMDGLIKRGLVRRVQPPAIPGAVFLPNALYYAK